MACDAVKNLILSLFPLSVKHSPINKKYNDKQHSCTDRTGLKRERKNFPKNTWEFEGVVGGVGGAWCGGQLSHQRP